MAPIIAIGAGAFTNIELTKDNDMHTTNKLTAHTQSDIEYVLQNHGKQAKETICLNLNINGQTYDYIIKVYGQGKELR